MPTKLWEETRAEIVKKLEGEKGELCGACRFTSECYGKDDYHRCPAFSKIASMLADITCTRSCNICTHQKVCTVYKSISLESHRLDENIDVEVDMDDSEVNDKDFCDILADGIGKYCEHFEEVESGEEGKKKKQAVKNETTLSAGEAGPVIR